MTFPARILARAALALTQILSRSTPATPDPPAIKEYSSGLDVTVQYGAGLCRQSKPVDAKTLAIAHLRAERHWAEYYEGFARERWEVTRKYVRAQQAKVV